MRSFGKSGWSHDAVPAVNRDEALGLLERCGALLSGHFELTSGLHSDRYVQKARVLEQPEVAMRLAREIASWYRGIDVVLSPAVGAIPLGFAVALAAGARSIFAEREAQFSSVVDSVRETLAKVRTDVAELRAQRERLAARSRLSD